MDAIVGVEHARPFLEGDCQPLEGSSMLDPYMRIHPQRADTAAVTSAMGETRLSTSNSTRVQLSNNVIPVKQQQYHGRFSYRTVPCDPG